MITLGQGVEGEERRNVTTIPEDIRLKKIDSDRIHKRIGEIDRAMAKIRDRGGAPPHELARRRVFLSEELAELDRAILSLSEYVEATGVVG